MGPHRPRLLIATAIVTLGACSESEPVHLSAEGVDVTVSLRPFRLTVADGDGEVVLDTLTDGGTGPYGPPAATVDTPIFEPQIVIGWDDYRPSDGPWQRRRRAELVGKSAHWAVVELPDAQSTVELAVSVSPHRVTLNVRADPIVEHEPGGRHTKTGISFRLPEDEHFFGLGERFATLDHRGWSLYSWTEEVGIGRGEDHAAAADNPIPNGPSMTGFPVPFVLSNRGYALHLDTPYRSEMHLGSERPDAWRVAVGANAFAATVYVNSDPLAILDAYTADTGRPMIPAPWVFGPRRRVSPHQEVDGVPEWRLLRERNVPTTGLDDAVHFLPANHHVGREAELTDWVDTLHANGFKVMAYNNPYVSKSEPSARAEYEHGFEEGLFVLNERGYPGETWFISGSLQTLATIDLTNPRAVEWFQQLMSRTLDLGYDGWMHDFGEYIQRTWKAWDGRRGDELHNLFPVLSAKAAHELLERERPNDYLFFVRSGYTGTQRWVPAVWGSDAESTFDPVQGIPAALRGGLNLAISGVPLWGSDVTGFKCLTDDPYDKEVYLRWGQLGAVSPIMMEQNACSNPLGWRQKWTLWSDEETTRVYGEAARLHTRLQPYFLVLAERAHQRGTPLMLHPILRFPNEPHAWEVEDAFFLGDALYAAPVVTRGERMRLVWLPPGDYVDRVDYTRYAGGRTVTIPAPLDKLPLLLVAGELLPMWDASIETLAPATDPDVVTPETVSDRLDVQVALLPGQSATLRLVDGTVLTARRLPIDWGNLEGLEQVDPPALPECSHCWHEDTPGDVTRLRINGSLTSTETVTLDDVEVSTSGTVERRVRWEVVKL